MKGFAVASQNLSILSFLQVPAKSGSLHRQANWDVLESKSLAHGHFSLCWCLIWGTDIYQSIAKSSIGPGSI